MPASESQRRCLSKLAAWPMGTWVVSVHRGSAGKAFQQQHGVSMGFRWLSNSGGHCFPIEPAHGDASSCTHCSVLQIGRTLQSVAKVSL